MINGRNTAGAQWTNGWGVFKPTWVLHMILPLHDIKHQLNEKFPSALNLSHQLANGSIVLVVSYIWQPVLPHLICLLAASMFNWKHGTMEPSFEDWNQLMGAPENTVNHPWSGGSKNPLSQIFFPLKFLPPEAEGMQVYPPFCSGGGGFLVLVVVFWLWLLLLLLWWWWGVLPSRFFSLLVHSRPWPDTSLLLLPCQNGDQKEMTEHHEVEVSDLPFGN